jgi:DNA polymerase III sliding clamp (beta) subunit (PCNA family)
VNADLGEAVEEVACEYEGPDFRLGINPDYLSQFLAAVDTDRVRLELKDENTQCVGYPQETLPGDGAGPHATDAGDTGDTAAGAPGAAESSDAASGSGQSAGGDGRYLCVIMPMRI